ncbi:hypothetical protein [Mailhella sp.]
MKIRFASVPPALFDTVSTLCKHLEITMENGDMDAVDHTISTLLSLTEKGIFFDLDEDTWKAFLQNVRKGESTFHADYLIANDILQSPAVYEATKQLGPADAVIAKALEDRSCIIQLPYPEEMPYVR